MKTFLLNLLTGIAAVGIASPALANISLSLEPGPQTINVGDPAVMDLVVSGLGNHASPSLGAFSLDLSYNPAILSAVSLTFGNSLDLGVLGSLRFSDLSTAGAIHLEEVSLESSTDLNNAQASTFTLATLNFTSLAPGTSAIDFTSASLSDEQGTSLTGFLSKGGSIQVRGTTPVPDVGSTASMLLLGLVSVLALRRFPQAEMS
jgi:hypothetical protein